MYSENTFSGAYVAATLLWVMHIIVLSVVTMVTYINLFVQLVQNNVKYTGGSGDKQTTSITLSISSLIMRHGGHQLLLLPVICICSLWWLWLFVASVIDYAVRGTEYTLTQVLLWWHSCNELWSTYSEFIGFYRKKRITWLANICILYILYKTCFVTKLSWWLM